MGSIQIMDELLSNKIAAGEVVERPASVVKELVENAIDAGSTKIEVFLVEAGLTRIQVIDNGKGMDEADVMLAFARHATSKIHREQDLFRIRTLGFRGEALASISSVSKVFVSSSDGESGAKLALEGGRVVLQEGASLRKGTDIAVEQLFFNTPARLKYLKTIQTELGHSIDLLNRLALSHPSIAFKLVHNEQVLLETNGRGDVLQVLAAIYGVPNAKKMIAFSGQSNDYKVHGFTTLPELTRASKNYISVFVNGRWVKHFLVQKAIIDAYHTFLPIERFPLTAIYIEGDPQLTDVNVHPAKHQIRLSKEPELLALIEQTIRTKLREVMQAPQVEKKEKRERVPSEQMNLWKPANQPVLNEPKLQSVVERLSSTYEPKWQAVRETGQTTVEPIAMEPTWEPEVVADVGSAKEQVTGPQSVEKELSRQPFPAVEIVGQIHGTYIVAQMEDGFYLIDQHAAQERIKYEYFRDKVGEVNADERQALLLPLTFHYAQDEALMLAEHRALLEQVGVYLEPFGQGTFVVREHPTWFPQGFEQEIIEDLIEQVLTSRKVDVKKLREEAAILMSCKRSIKANFHLTREQMEQLVADLREAENPFTCPHGRPVLVHFSTYEVEKMFKRVM